MTIISSAYNSHNKIGFIRKNIVKFAQQKFGELETATIFNKTSVKVPRIVGGHLLFFFYYDVKESSKSQKNKKWRSLCFRKI